MLSGSFAFLSAEAAERWSGFCEYPVLLRQIIKHKPGDHVILNIPDLQTPDIKPENIPLDILYEDQWLMVVNKPKDMVVHPSAGHMEGTLVNAVMAHCEIISPESMELCVLVSFIVSIKTLRGLF